MNLILNHEGFETYLIKTKPRNGGIQYLFKFKNNYGASVVKHNYSYGHESDLWELAVIKFYDEDEYDLNYDTDITNDVLGRLTDEEVKEYLKQIKDL